MAEQKTILIGDKSNFVYYYTAGYATFWEDTARKPDIKVAFELFKKGKFQTPVLENQLGLSRHGFWVAIPVSNKATHEARLFLEMQNLHINEVRFFLVSPSGQVQYSAITGDMLPFVERPLQVRNFVFPVNIPSETTVVCLLYLRNIGETVSLPLFLHDQGTYHRSEGLFALMVHLTVGFLGAMGFWALVLYTKRRETAYLNYFLYILSLVGWMLGNYGFGYMYLWPNHPLWQQVLPPLLGLISYMMFMNFGYHFFQIGSWKGILKWGYWGVLGAGAVVLVALLWYPIFSQTLPDLWILESLMFCMLAGQFVMIASIVVLLRKKITVALALFTLAFVSSVVSGLTVLLREMIPMPVNFITEHGMMLGWVIEAVLLALSIATMLESQLLERHQLLLNQRVHQQELLAAEVGAREEEAARIASDLHDEMGMLLTTAQHFLSNHRFDESQKSIILCMEKVRQVTHALHPMEVTTFGLSAVLEEMTVSLSNNNTKIEFINRLPFELKDEMAVIIYRCISELLTNAIRHAKANQISLRLNHVDNHLEITIQDNGVGFSNVEGTTTGLGLKSVESRIQYLRGQYGLDSQLGEGTFIRLSIPLTPIPFPNLQFV